MGAGMAIHLTRRAVILTFVLLVAALLGLGLPIDARALDVGQRAPDFSLPATTGGTVSLAQFRGKQVVLIEFYGADFSPV